MLKYVAFPALGYAERDKNTTLVIQN